MPTALYTHPICQEHEMGSWHPECPARLKAILQVLDAEPFANLQRREAPVGSVAEIERVHQAYYVESIFDQMPSSGHVHLDPDTALSPASGDAAMRAVGGICDAVDAVVNREVRNAFCAVRPPGHHAETSAAMGFCLFNNVAVGALHARETHGLERIAVIDFDVHHGNGTQAMFADDRALFYGSTHQSPLYPGTGAASERGRGNIVNAPLAPGADSDAFRAAMTGHVLPALDRFKPEFIFISAGFDAHAGDPLAQLRLEDEDYAWATQELTALAEKHCAGRVVSTLEGGYDLAALAASARAHVRALMGA